VTPPISPSLRAALGSVLLALLVAAPASALTSELRILINVDVSPTTGCDVTTVDGVFPGVEQILVTTVETSGTTGQVTLVERHECVDEATDAFGPAIPVSAGGWPVGVGLGLDGSDVVETFVGVSDVGGASPPPVIRLGVVGDNGVEQDALLVVQPVGNQPILLNLVTVLEIPTLSEWGLILLALLLAALALGRMRRLRRRHAVTLLLLACLGISVVAWASVRDGLIDDWLGVSPLAEDPQADAPPGADLRALFARAVGGEICFRLDVFLAFNQPPDAVDDDFATDEDTVLNVATPGVLANDSDPESDPLTVTAFDATSAQGAAMTVNADGSFSYDPTGAAALQALAQGDAVGDTFTYTIEDPDGGSDTATVTVTVDGVNDAPTAVGDNFATDEDTTLNAPAPGVLVNDTDPDTGDSLTAVLDTGPSNASSFTLNPDGSFDYTPVLNFNGDDTFTYHASDGTASSATVTVTLTVGPLNDGPNAVDDMFSTDEDTALNVAAPGVLTNDTDPEMDALTVTAFDAVSTQGATVSVNADGSFTYDPTGAAALQALAAGAMLNDTFTYTIEDPGADSDTATVTIEVSGVDDPPTAVNDTATVTEDDPATTIDVLANDPDPDGGTKEIIGITQPANGTVVNNTTDLTYQPDPDYCNDGSPTDDFTYTITGGSMATVSVTVTCVNDAPMVVGETFDVAAGNFAPAIGNTTLQLANTDTVTTPHVFVLGDVLDNDSDPESDPLSITAFQNPSTQGGTVVMNLATGEFTYLPPVGFEGVDTFTYTVFDGTTGVMGTVTIEVADMVWYLDNDPANDGSGDDGRSSSPFDSIAQLEAENGGGAADDPEAGDIIFIFQGTSTYDAGGGDTDGIDLLDQQKLLGEGVDLVVQSLTLVSGNPANQPSIDNTNMGGDAVTVLATAGNRTGIEIRGLSIDGTDNAIEVTSSGANQVGATISDNTLAGSGAEGIDLNPGSSGAFVVLMENNVFSTASAVGTAIDLTTTGASGDVEIALNANTNVTSSGSAGIVLDNSGGGGKLFITGFSGNTVHGNTVGDGIRILAATFDADPGDADFTGDEVSGGNTTVGVGNPVGGSAMVLTNVSGDLAFGTLNLSTDGMGAVGLDVTGSGLINAGAGTGFEITSTGGTVSSADGPAVVLDPLTAGLTFGSVSSASSPTTGVSLTDIAGTFSAAGGSITGAAGTSFNINGGTPSVTYNGSITHSGNATRTIEIQSMTGGSATFGGAVSATDGTGIRIANNTGTNTVSFTSTVDLGTGVGTRLTDGDAFTMSGNSNGTTVSATDLDVFTNGVQGVVASGSGALNLDALSLDTTGNGGRALNLAGIQSLVDVDTATCSNNSDCVTLSSLAALSTTTFTGVGLTCTGGTCFDASSARTVEVTGNGNTIGATNAVGLNMTSTTIGVNDATFESISASGATNGIVLNTTGTSGGLKVTGTGAANSGGTIQNATGDGVVLATTEQVSLTEMRVLSSADNAFDLDSVNGLILDSLIVDMTGGHGILGTTVTDLVIRNNSLIDRAGDAANEHGLFITDLLGSSSIVDSTFRRSSTIQAFIRNETATAAAPAAPLDILRISGCTFDQHTGTFFGDHLSVESITAGNLRLTVDGTDGVNTFDTGQDGIQANATSGGTLDVSITGVSRTNGTGTGINLGGFNAATLTFDVFDNNAGNGTGITGTESIGINATSIGGAQVSGQIRNNDVNGSVSVAPGIVAIVEGNGTETISITGNNVGSVGTRYLTADHGIRLQARAGTGTMNATVTSNQVHIGDLDPLLNPSLEGIGVESGSSAGGDTNTVCLNMANNNSTVANGDQGYRLRQRTGTTFNLQDFAGNGAVVADVTNWVTTTKTNTGTVQVLIGSTFSAAPAACPTP